MQKKSIRIPASALALAGSAAGFALRKWLLTQAYDDEGLMIRGSVSIWVLGIFCAVVVLAFALLAGRLGKRADYESTFSSSGFCFAASVLAGALVLAGSAAGVLEDPAAVRMILGFLGIASGVCFLAIGAGRFRGKAVGPGVHILPVVYLVFKLIVDFKQWSIDPAILDYCFSLFAAISAMCAVYTVAGFCFGKGGRRMSAFWCLTGTVLTAVSLADGGLQNLLLGGGLWLWLAVNGWQILED